MSGSMARLDFARGRYEDVYDSTCDVYRNGALLHDSIPCVVEVPNDNNQQLEGQSVPVGAFLVAVPIDYVIEVGDHVIERSRRLEVVISTITKSYEIRHEVIAILVGAA